MHCPDIVFISVHFPLCTAAAPQGNSNTNFANFEAFGNTAIPSHLSTSPPSKSFTSGTPPAYLCHPHVIFWFVSCSLCAPFKPFLYTRCVTQRQHISFGFQNVSKLKPALSAVDVWNSLLHLFCWINLRKMHHHSVPQPSWLTLKRFFMNI